MKIKLIITESNKLIKSFKAKVKRLESKQKKQAHNLQWLNIEHTIKSCKEFMDTVSELKKTKLKLSEIKDSVDYTIIVEAKNKKYEITFNKCFYGDYLTTPLDHKYLIANGISIHNRKLDKHYDILTFMPITEVLISFCIECASGVVTLSCSSTNVDLEIVRTQNVKTDN
jgi:hypothetical protein